jgi:hypothetical protein
MSYMTRMAQHFLLSRAAKSLSLADVFRMSDAEAETAFRRVRWPETDGVRFARTVAALMLTIAAVPAVRLVSSAALAERISALQ